jgi:hypothetical protein
MRLASRMALRRAIPEQSGIACPPPLPRGDAGRLGSGPALGPPLFVHRTPLPSFPRKRESTPSAGVTCVINDGPSSGEYTGRSPKGMAGRLGSGPAPARPSSVSAPLSPPSFPRKRESTPSAGVTCVINDGPSSGEYTGRSPEGMAGRLGSGPALGPPLFGQRPDLVIPAKAGIHPINERRSPRRRPWPIATRRADRGPAMTLQGSAPSVGSPNCRAVCASAAL